jgi:sterol desaturase/sphingolipid hydroxylase (fatty acid hydroxylase superfamily)
MGTLDWTFKSIVFEVQWFTNYFWGLTVLSLIVWGLEYMFPWRKNQAIVRKDFWLDWCYMYFNFFVFSIFIAGFYQLFSVLFLAMGITHSSLAIMDLSTLPWWLELLVFFVILDFVQWFTHVMLHKFSILWQFHKVHHSVEQMGFAAHLRYHWMENIFYKPLKTIGVMLIGGFEPDQAYMVHFFAISIGHLNHANIKITWGPFKYIFNNSVMHLWHHAMHLPVDRRLGVNFGISLSMWDYIFKTNYIPEESGQIELGFEGLDKFPKSFIKQLLHGFGKSKKD